jgi:hypothetical protein
MAKLQIRFPGLCAWCGTRPPSANRAVSLSQRIGQKTHQMSFQAPICPTCEAHANALAQASKKRNWLIVGGCVVVGLILAVLLALAGGESGMIVILWPMISFFLGVIISIIFAIFRLGAKLNSRAVGPPPEGYASTDTEPCKLAGGQMLEFYSDAFHQQFAVLNPTLAMQRK